MKTITYSDLFEDEVAEVLRDHPLQNTIIFIDRYMFCPANMICEDGIYTSGAGYFSEYLNGIRTGNHINAKAFPHVLAHRLFTVKIRDVII